jgi:aminoglycoside 2''-phosphotransferase
MRADARKEVSRHFRGYLDCSESYTYRPVLQHGDFGGSNILYHAQDCTIAGIIDFGFAAVGDPALDLAAVSMYGMEFLQRLEREYPNLRTTIDRVKFYRGTFALHEALHGTKNGDEEAFKAGMAGYI